MTDTRRTSLTWRVVLATTALAVLGGVVGCTDESVAPPPSTTQATIDPLARAATQEESEPVPTLPTPPGYVPADTRNVALPVGVSAPVVEPPIPVLGGKARLHGRVFGPDGPVPKATVRLERFVGARGGYTEVTTDDSGSWWAEGLLGGRFRLRAYERPSLATTEPQVAFVAGDADLAVDILVDRFDRRRLQAALTVGNIQPDFPVVLRVRRDHEEVDGNGIVQGVPPDESQEVTVTVEEGMEVVGEDRRMTGADGTADFTMVCHVTGPHRLTATAGDLVVTIDLPPCERPPVDAPSTTSTTAAPPASSTTSTTVVDIDVGESLDPPVAGPVPPGTYEVVADGDGCVTRYEERRGDAWVLIDASGGRLTFTGVARNIEARPGTPVCRFRRTA
jgi:hypothetical protein